MKDILLFSQGKDGVSWQPWQQLFEIFLPSIESELLIEPVFTIFDANRVIMKKLLLFLALITSSVVHGQVTSYLKFKLVDQEIIYQSVFMQDSVTATALEAFYKTKSYASNVVASAEGLQFDVTDLTVDFKKFQFTQVGTPSIMQTGKFSGVITVGVKDGRYRITFKSIQVTGDVGYKKITEKESLTTYATKNSATILSPDWCRPNMLGLLDQAFTDKLQYKKIKDDW